MQSRAILINVRRGGLWCEADIVKALEGKIIAGIGTDVFEQEPATQYTSPFLKGLEVWLLVLMWLGTAVLALIM